MGRRRTLTDEEERIIREAVARGASDEEARIAAGVSSRRLYEARRGGPLADLPRRPRGARGLGLGLGAIPDLPRSVIYARAAQIRAGWTEEERARRFHAAYVPLDADD